jgi:subfamily B ATP-binding cassette protein MsbA
MSAGDFVRYLTLLIFSYQPWKALGGLTNTIQGGLAAADRVFGIMDTEAERIETADTQRTPSFTRALSYRDVSFTYPGTQKRVLHHVSFTVEKGHVVALVGPSGAGKSTVLDLLARFYDVQDGGIYIDGRNITDIDVASLRRLFGIVTQQTVLFNDTVFNNIGYGVTDPSPQRVIEAARAANAHDFIEQLAEGYETMIGENGVMLSGGQCQRIAIARALLKDPQVLIFDEATSSLDTESEKLVQSAIDRLMKNRTTLVVAHRLSTVQHAHTIVVMEHGRIVETGDHATLLAQDGKYRQLYDMQFAAPGRDV